MSKFVITGFADEAAKYPVDQIKVLDPLNIRYIELRGCGNCAVGELTASKAENLARFFEDNGYRISAIGSAVGKVKIGSDMDAHFDFFCNNLLMAKIFNTKYIRMFSFYSNSEEDPVTNHRDEVMFQLERYMKEADKFGVTLLHENEKAIYGQNPKECLDLANTLGMGLIFDPANFIQSDNETYPEAFDMLKNHIRYMHIKDCNKDTHMVQPCGYGDARIKDILKELDKMNFNGFLSLEPHLQAFDGFDKLESEMESESSAFAMKDKGSMAYTVAAEALFKTMESVGIKPSFSF